MTDHPSATDYRDRAERAEQEAREAWACADRLAEALERIANLEGITHGWAVSAQNIARQAVDAYRAERVR